MGNILINHEEGGVHEIKYQADHSDGFNADFFYNSTADEIIFKRIKPIIKDFELKLKSVSPPLGNSLPSDHQQKEKNNNYLHEAGAGPNIFKPLRIGMLKKKQNKTKEYSYCDISSIRGM